MLLVPGYDEAVDAIEAFVEACRLYPEDLLSWRRHSCANETLVEVKQTIQVQLWRAVLPESEIKGLSMRLSL
jgi:hypothetical protein